MPIRMRTNSNRPGSPAAAGCVAKANNNAAAVPILPPRVRPADFTSRPPRFVMPTLGMLLRAGQRLAVGSLLLSGTAFAAENAAKETHAPADFKPYKEILSG